ncbi:MAG TPA: zf-HC2 domain-containing protein [Phycisphaerales bacterium]|nr:zf-HC2 domain-containing protein [Phycisphaerales bacterium]
MTMTPDRFQDLLDAYLDGRLSLQERSEFEKHLAADAWAMRQYQDAMAIEEGLRQLFAPPAAGELVPELPGSDAIPFPRAVPGQVARTMGRGGWILAAAATLLIGVSAAVYLAVGHTPSNNATDAATSGTLTPAELYARLMKKQFRPAFKCENDAQFSAFLGDRFGTGAVLAQAPAVEVLGWDYADGMLGEATAVIMTRVEGKEVVLVVDEEKYDRTLPEPGQGLSMFRETCNRLVFYEITPLGDARVLPLVRAAPPLVLQSD